MQQHLSPILTAARVIPQAYADRERHSPAWRYLLQQIRYADRPTSGERELARIYQAYLALPNGDAINADGTANHSKVAVAIRISEMANDLGFYATSKVGDTAPFELGKYPIDGLTQSEIPADGEMIEVVHPIVYGADGVVCLGDWEKI